MQKIVRKDIPNILSALRIVLVVLFVASFFFFKKDIAAHVSLLIFILAGISDVVDGYLARKNNWISDLGKILAFTACS